VVAGDTIAAVATATGVGGIGVVRVSGPGALAIVGAVTGEVALPDRRAQRVVVRDRGGRRLDDGLALAMRGPRSFTGEDVVELHVHGGAINLGAVLGAVVAAGARVAEPGEFTRRALAAGKIDVVRAEAMLAVVGAQSERAWALAQRNLAGELSAAVAGLRAEAIALLAEVEAGLDFPDEDLTPAAIDEVRARAAGLAGACSRLAGSFGAGRALVQGMVVALVGAVNAGKSSLLNALVGHERALVSDEPGTTRDYVEARVEWRGVAVTLVDTAGLRDGGLALEVAGRELGQRRAAEADVVLAIVGPGDGAPAVDARTIVVASKCDLGGVMPAGALPTSAMTGAGLEALRAAVLARVGVVDDVESGSAVVLSERQRAAAVEAAARFAAAAELPAAIVPEVRALELRAGAVALAALVGEQVGEDVLDALFARFCIGK
jgi:tRNA modification GTPase